MSTNDERLIPYSEAKADLQALYTAFRNSEWVGLETMKAIDAIKTKWGLE